MRFLPLVCLAAAAGCATIPATFPISYDVVDMPERGGLLVQFRNPFRDSVCLTPDQWPNQAGWIDHAGERVSLEVSGQRFPMQMFNTGFCPGCSARVRPGESVSSFVPYRHFGLPADLHQAAKRSVLAPIGNRCGYRSYRPWG
jgi:hypothetical protein